ncbi:MAG: S4 domain-containing protein [Chloroflexota bacterium]|nr:S4 domain-containing protein [Chloroflexota bacterium]
MKTSPLATRLCEAGHVLVNGVPAKPSTKVRAGDRLRRSSPIASASSRS